MSPKEAVRFPCPCCGYPTLGERVAYEICELCNLEDDGQEDPHADEVRGGPNQAYSLSEARSNFRKNLIMYDPAKQDGRQNTQAVNNAKHMLIQLFDRMLELTDEAKRENLWQQVREAESVLFSIEYPRQAGN